MNLDLNVVLFSGLYNSHPLPVLPLRTRAWDFLLPCVGYFVRNWSPTGQVFPAERFACSSFIGRMAWHGMAEFFCSYLPALRRQMDFELRVTVSGWIYV